MNASHATLLGGEQQMLAIAGPAAAAEVLLIDELGMGLAPVSRRIHPADAAQRRVRPYRTAIVLVERRATRSR